MEQFMVVATNAPRPEAYVRMVQELQTAVRTRRCGCGSESTHARGKSGGGASVFCDRCWSVEERAQARSRPTPLPPSPPKEIGSIVGIAVPLTEPCVIARLDGASETERFALAAFDRSIERGGQDVRIGHSGAPIPGRIELFIDARQLKFRLRVHDTPLGREALARVRSGEFRGASIGFKEIRGNAASEITEADLRHIALTNHPAWYGTSVRIEQ